MTIFPVYGAGTWEGKEVLNCAKIDSFDKKFYYQYWLCNIIVGESVYKNARWWGFTNPIVWNVETSMATNIEVFVLFLNSNTSHKKWCKCCFWCVDYE